MIIVCNAHNGLILRLNAPGGEERLHLAAGVNVLAGDDEAFWAKWAEANAGSDLLTGGMLLAHTNADEGLAETSDQPPPVKTGRTGRKRR